MGSCRLNRATNLQETGFARPSAVVLAKRFGRGRPHIIVTNGLNHKAKENKFGAPETFLN